MGIEKKDPANFNPSVEIPAKVDSFRFWCQKVLPLVYDDSLSYYELLCKVVDYLNNTIADVNTLGTDVDNLNKAYNELQSYVNNYFSTLDVQEEINNKLDVMAQDGTLSELIQPLFDTYTTDINNKIKNQNEAITTLKNRMDTFSALTEGSTTGDAELMDIRVPAYNYNSNQNYNSAGDAVRGETLTTDNNSKTRYNDILQKLRYTNSTNLFDNSIAINNVGNYKSDGSFGNTSQEDRGYRYYKIYVESNTDYVVSTFSNICFYSNETFISGRVNATTNPLKITTPISCNIMIISTTINNLSSMIVNKGDTIDINSTNINSINIKNLLSEANSKTLFSAILESLGFTNATNLFIRDVAYNQIGNYRSDGSFDNSTAEGKNYRYYKIYVEGNTDYIVSTFSNICFYSNETFISGTYNPTTEALKVTTPISCNVMIISTTIDNLYNMIVNKGDTININSTNKNTINIENTVKYPLPYVSNHMLQCKKVNDGTTAFYAGLKTPHIFSVFNAEFIFEKGLQSGTVAMICNNNGLNKISDITQSSFHLTITNTHLKIDLLGEKYGKYYYHNFIDTDLAETIPLDGVTKTLVNIGFSGIDFTVNVIHPNKTETFNFSWGGDSEHTLSDFIGNYVTIEHYCGGNMDNYAMPMFTLFEIKSNDYRIFDYFERENGVLSTTPSGDVYTLLTNDIKYSGNLN